MLYKYDNANTVHNFYYYAIVSFIKLYISFLMSNNYQRKSFNGTGYIYFISDGQYIKIGYSTSPRARLSVLQCGNPKKLSIVAMIKTKHPYYLEMYVHNIFSKYKQFGEWFLLPKNWIKELEYSLEVF